MNDIGKTKKYLQIQQHKDFAEKLGYTPRHLCVLGKKPSLPSHLTNHCRALRQFFYAFRMASTIRDNLEQATIAFQKEDTKTMRHHLERSFITANHLTKTMEDWHHGKTPIE